MEADSTPIKQTKSVLRKALCDMLRPVLPDTTVLELFAGTGKVGEALLHEGARTLYAVDRREAPEELSKNEAVHWFRQDVFDFLKFGPPESVGIVFLDPPYSTDHANRVLKILAETDWLVEKGIVAVETDRDQELPESLNERLWLMRDRRYGDSRLRIYQADRTEHP